MTKVLYCLISCYLLVSCTSVHQIETPEVADVYLKSFKEYQYPPAGKMLNNKVDNLKLNKHFLDNHFSKVKLKNGLEVYYRSNHDLPIISIAAIVNAGKYQSVHKDKLLSPMVLKLLKQGTEKYDRSQFQQQIASLGEPMQYWQTAQYSVLSIAVLPSDLRQVLELMSQQLLYINPDKNAVQKVAEQQRLEMILAQSSGATIARNLFYHLHYPEQHPYFYQNFDSETIKAINEKELLDFYNKNYTADRLKFVIMGDFDEHFLKSQIEAFFSQNTDSENFKKKNIIQNSVVLAKPARQSSVQIKQLSADKIHIDFYHRKGAQQVDLLLGMITVARTSPDWLALKMLAAILGGGPSSRLFTDLREQQGLAYSVSSRQLSGLYPSPFFIKTSIAYEKLLPAIKTINQHLDYLCQNAVGEIELSQIKRQLSGEMMFKLQTNRQRINDKIYQLEHDLPEDYLAKEIQEIKQMTARKLRDTSNRYLCQQRHLILVGQKNKLLQRLRGKFQQDLIKEH